MSRAPSPPPAGPQDAPTGARQVSCPQCRQPTWYSPANPYRPFCSARCQGHDFGAWAAEDYRVAAAPPATEGDLD